MSTKWLGNVRLPPETMRDMSDQEWWELLTKKYGPEHIHIGPPKACEGRDARWWNERGMSGLYIDEEVL